jgi:pimeloyl-ACP methyl ester carboxylesterase
MSVKEIVDHYDAIIRGLDRPPIIMGHSFGGLHTQLLLDRGLGAAGVTLGTGARKEC